MQTWSKGGKSLVKWMKGGTGWLNEVERVEWVYQWGWRRMNHCEGENRVKEGEEVRPKLKWQVKVESLTGLRGNSRTYADMTGKSHGWAHERRKLRECLHQWGLNNDDVMRRLNWMKTEEWRADWMSTWEGDLHECRREGRVKWMSTWGKESNECRKESGRLRWMET